MRASASVLKAPFTLVVFLATTAVISPRAQSAPVKNIDPLAASARRNRVRFCLQGAMG